MEKSVTRSRPEQKNVRVLRKFATLDLSLDFTSRLMEENRLNLDTIEQLWFRINARGSSHEAEVENVRDRALIADLVKNVRVRKARIEELRAYSQLLEGRAA